jgi:hypothetical protein
MKIALLFSGRIKAWDECYPNFKKNILESNSEHTIHSYLCHNADNSLPDLERFCDLYNIKKYENIHINIDELVRQIPLAPNMAAKYLSFKMYFCWYRAFQLMKSSDINYDIVINFRADIVLNQPLLFTEIFKHVDSLYVPSDFDHGGMNDQIALGSMATMEYYVNIYNKLLEIYETTKTPFHTETYVKLYNKPLQIKRFPLQYNLHPGRF